MNEKQILSDLIRANAPLVAMVAPSFPIMYEYPHIVGRIRALGFRHVIEVSVGAKETNREVVELLKSNPKGRYITSPCPGFVRLIRRRFPALASYLAFQADSPMIASARIVREKYPESRPVFIGPCVQKKLESSEDYPDLEIIVITYKELNDLFTQFNIPDTQYPHEVFDLAEAATRSYPTDGGLTYTSGANNILSPDEIRIVSGWKNVESAIKEFQENTKIRLLDVLFCDGGCISGPGITSVLSVDERVKKVMHYAKGEDTNKQEVIT